VSEINREVDQAISALVVEVMKLSPLEGAAGDALRVTIENALERLASGIIAQARNIPEACPCEPLPVEFHPVSS
jgi:hypothetical protein